MQEKFPHGPHFDTSGKIFSVRVLNYFCEIPVLKSEISVLRYLGDPNIFTSKIKEITERNKQKQKPLVLIDDLNLNPLDYATINHVQNFFNLAFENGVFPVINRPTRITKTSETAIDHILTNIRSRSSQWKKE